MKAQEVRVGNFVMDGKDIEPVNARMISMLENGQADFDPIPLTEEWLVRFGFEKSPIGWFTMSIGSITIYVALAAKTVMFSNIVLTNFHHIHRLQNLIFDFTGEELTTKTPIQ